MDLPDLLEDLISEDFLCLDDSYVVQEVDSLVRAGCLTVTQCEVKVREILISISDGFCFAKKSKHLLENNDKVLQLTHLLHAKLCECVIVKSHLKGVNREASQADFFRLMSSVDATSGITALTGSHQLTMWICTSLFPHFYSPANEPSAGAAESSSLSLSEEEADIVGYIGGFVCSKLKQRSATEAYTAVVNAFITDEAPNPKTLIAAKCRGKLTNLENDGHNFFKQLEIVFRLMFSAQVSTAKFQNYKDACCKESVVQDCFHNATDNLDEGVKDRVLLDMIFLYYKVRMHHKCKILVQKARAKKTSQKDRALRSKLAK